MTYLRGGWRLFGMLRVQTIQIEVNASQGGYSGGTVGIVP